MPKRLLAVAALVSMMSCSFFIRGVDSDRQPQERPNCQNFIIAPIADGAVGGLVGLYGATQCGRSGTACVSALIVGGVFLSAAVLGTYKILKCRKAFDEYREANQLESED